MLFYTGSVFYLTTQHAFYTASVFYLTIQHDFCTVSVFYLTNQHAFVKSSVFYLTTIVWHIVLLLRRACGVALGYHNKRADMTRQPRVVR
jgi:hypothetical protein